MQKKISALSHTYFLWPRESKTWRKVKKEKTTTCFTHYQLYNVCFAFLGNIKLLFDFFPETGSGTLVYHFTNLIKTMRRMVSEIWNEISNENELFT